MPLTKPPHYLLGIVGFPLGHSLSPLLFTWLLDHYELPGAYMRWELHPECLRDFITAVRTLGLRGVSVTIPHKEKVIRHLDGVTAACGRVGAVNTLFWEDGRLLGENTDIIGFMEPLQARSISSALVLGAGGAARAALAGLRDLCVPSIGITNRSESRAKILAGEFGVSVVPWEQRAEAKTQLIVNTTPLGMHGDLENESPWPVDGFHKGQIVYDFVYNPIKTKLQREAEAAGCVIVDGLEMFLGQAAAQFKLWTGKELPVVECRELLIAALGKD